MDEYPLGTSVEQQGNELRELGIKGCDVYLTWSDFLVTHSSYQQCAAVSLPLPHSSADAFCHPRQG